MSTDIEFWESKFLSLLESYTPTDPSHDKGHFRRVWSIAREIAQFEDNCDHLTILAASYFHDFKSLPKNHPDRSKASKFSAEQATIYLRNLGFPESKLENVFHCIEAHSFSAGVRPTSIEAKIVQDADRIEAMGAIGIARIFAVAGSIGSMPFHPEDPLAKTRPLDDQKYALDHFFKKIFIIQNNLGTRGGRHLGQKRAEFMKSYVDQLMTEIQL